MKDTDITSEMLYKLYRDKCTQLFNETFDEMCRTGKTGVRIFYTKPPYKQLELKLEWTS